MAARANKRFPYYVPDYVLEDETRTLGAFALYKTFGSDSKSQWSRASLPVGNGKTRWYFDSVDDAQYFANRAHTGMRFKKISRDHWAFE